MLILQIIDFLLVHTIHFIIVYDFIHANDYPYYIYIKFLYS